MIDPARITGIVLAGGRGSRMGGVDKGLQTLDGLTLVEHALRRLAPQVASMMISANRNLDIYGRFGVPVWTDGESGFPGPLAGFLAGIAHATTDWLATVPCDVPRFPPDLVARLCGGLADASPSGGSVAVAAATSGGIRQVEPAFCLVPVALRDDLAAYLAGGGRRIDRWLGRHRCIEVDFDDAAAFVNANTIDELRKLGAA